MNPSKAKLIFQSLDLTKKTLASFPGIQFEEKAAKLIGHNFFLFYKKIIKIIRIISFKRVVLVIKQII